MPTPRLTAEQAQDALNQLVVQVATRRAKLYQSFVITPEMPEWEQRSRAQLLVQTLHRWSKDPLAFIEDAAWAPDRKGRFGSGHIPKNLGLPANMVPSSSIMGF